MPIYEYQCKQCGEFEVTQRITETPLTICPTCGSAIHRLISHTSFVLKGSGWYATDYARSNGKSDGSADAASGSGEAPSKAAAASDSSDKPAAASEAKTSTAESSKPASDKSAAAKAAD